MDHYVLVMHPGDKDPITAQIAARNGKTILFVKSQCGADRLADNLAKAGVVVLAKTKQQTSVKGLTSRAGVTPKFVGVKPNDAELMTITGTQEPSSIPCVAPIVESRGPARSGENVLGRIQVSVVDGLGRSIYFLVRNASKSTILQH